ncbi:HlyD family secretion protein [Amaricoccus solimangrovi]|uniref:HlyD family secretion protein n=1 Tax=Amaricoccus solimangrovi TaxID=2589815 RepID=A0A501WW55_9RHOB|nr:HlyD family secretion protein [Amaricoccus solimangrovi]TPE52670.1 HlyD family secretion protein [Amaricoccus solimangrovi]
MLELLLCSAITILPDFLYRRFVQGKRIGREITLFSVWYELRWGITFCVILTVSLITTIFYFHPATNNAVSVFRTVTILPETGGRVAETYVGINQHVTAGQPLFRLDTSAQEAAIETAKRRIAEVEAGMEVARAQLAEADGRITQARGSLKQATDEYETRAELIRRNPNAISQREVDRVRVAMETAQGAVDAALAAKAAAQSQIDFALPAQKASAEAALREAEVARDKALVVAGTDGVVQQFALRPGDVVNPMLRPAGILVPDRHVTGLVAGFGQIEAQVIKVGMVGEVACAAIPFTVVPVVITDVQDVIASGQIRPTDQLQDATSFARPGTITAIMEPLFEGGLDRLPQGSSCVANAYTSNHDALQDPEIGAFHAFVLHAIDATGLVHAALLRMQALILPVRTLVLSGGH